MTSGKIIANLLNNQILGLLKKNKLTIEECPVAPEFLSFLARCIERGDLDKKQAKELIKKSFAANGSMVVG